MDWVVKIGGSLFPEDAIRLGEALIDKNVLVICGGGAFADKIREYDKYVGFSNKSNHKAAILCMDILGILLADKIEDSEIVYSLKAARKVDKEFRLPILLPSKLFEFIDPLLHSWNVTSDSISLYISNLLQTKLLIATNVDGIYTNVPSTENAKFIKSISAKRLLNFGETSVDVSLPELLLKYKTNCYIVNGKYPERAISIIDGKKSKYTFIGGE
jgi:5-(aminomethyl)-3-furanmethanol phosphate kinase